jgi:hypothetical protein
MKLVVNEMNDRLKTPSNLKDWIPHFRSSDSRRQVEKGTCFVCCPVPVYMFAFVANAGAGKTGVAVNLRGPALFLFLPMWTFLIQRIKPSLMFSY